MPISLFPNYQILRPRVSGPGYAASAQLTDLLDDLGYKYDGSLMPGPYGPVFRWMDRRLHAAEAPARLHPKPSTR